TDVCIEKAKQAQQLIRSPLLMTRGAHGMIYIDEDKTLTVPGIPLSGEIDSVGAGDTCISAFSSAAGSSADILDAMQIANMAAAVTVKKLRQTGTASPEEIMALNAAI
ncbi:MAG: carbohydrate kinase, partial [Calditrichaeota bacterium]|nr:carbohydrate kinase [Calditrichota bacterium]